MPSSVAFDCETFLIRPGLLAPPMVCLTSAMPAKCVRLFHVKEEMMPGGCLQKDVPGGGGSGNARRHFEWILKQDPIYGVNIAYDMAVCLNEWPDLFPEVFKAYDEGRVIDVSLCQQLIDNARGAMTFFKKQKGYSLAGMAKRILKKDRSAEKTDEDAWRLRYSELYDVHLHDWPEAAVKYAMDDAEDTLAIAQHQWLNHQDLMKDAPAQARAAWALHLMMCWGVRTDPERIQMLKEAAEEKYGTLTRTLVDHGLVRGDDAPPKQRGTRNTRAAQRRMLKIRLDKGLPLTLTKTGYKLYKERTGKKREDPQFIFSKDELVKYIAVDEDACNECGDDVMYDYSLRTQLHNILHTHVPDLLKGVHQPIQPSYSTMVESGRTSCAKSRSTDKKKPSPTNGFQFQNPKRSLAYFPPGVGIRECFIARPDRYLADADFTGLELCSGAQSCISTVGYSKLGEALNAGKDPHLMFAAQLMGISYEEALARKHEKIVKEFRQRSKPPNFGLPGGLGVPGLMGLARGYGVKLSPVEAKELIDNWFEMWPEWRDYFKYIRGHIDHVSGRGQIKQLYVGRIRGGVTYTSASNTLFQGLGADGSKAACYEVAKRCYTKVPGSVLYGARPLGFVHDEILSEVFIELAHEQAMEKARVMEDACNKFLPDVPVHCEPALAVRWSKDLESVYDRDKRLQPYDLAKEGKWEVYYGDGEPVKWKEAA